MTMNGDIEEVAAAAYREAGFGLNEQAPAVLLAQRLLGKKSVRELPQSVIHGTGALVRVGAEWRIYVRRESDATTKRFTVLHELSHFLLGKEASEQQCDQLAAALLLPRAPFLRAVRPTRMASVARSFGASETCVWRRVGEATAAPVAVVTPAVIHVSGAPHPWPAEPILRELAAAPRVRGLRKCRLSDDRNRAALAAGDFLRLPDAVDVRPRHYQLAR